MPLDTMIVTSGLSTKQLTRNLHPGPWGKEAGDEDIAQNFISLSSQEVLFHMGAQSTSYEKVASGCPDRLTAYYAIIIIIIIFIYLWQQNNLQCGEKYSKVMNLLQ